MTLAPHHYAMLHTGSAITDGVIKTRGYTSMDHPGEVQDLGFSKAQACTAPVLAIPLWDVHGQQSGWQIRPDSPRQMKDGKVFKYEAMKGGRLQLDVHPSIQPQIGDPHIPLWITEGVRKGDALVSAGACTIALTGGVWGFRGTNSHGGKVILPDWEHVALNGRLVYVAYDSDLHTKAGVDKALKALWTFLRSRQAIPARVHWPDEYQQQKWGVDDFLADNKTLDDVLAMVPPIGPMPATAPYQRNGSTLLPEIELTTEITEVADQTEDALLKTHGLHLFEHSRRLVTIAAGVKPPKGLKRPEGVPLISPLTPPRLTELASQAARFYTQTEDLRVYHRPPAWLIHTLMARTERPFSSLEAIVHAPTLRPDGSLIEAEGYDGDTGLYVDFGGMQYPPIASAPSPADARQALAQLKDPLAGFPFAEPYHASATLAMVLTLVCRHFVQSSVPIGGITAHGQGAGKGLLATVIALIGTGRPCAFWPQPTDEAEEKKRLLAIGLQGDSVVCIDNVTRPFGSGTFANVVTSMTYSDRILGVSQNAEVRFHCVWLVTGNNLTYVGDMARRVVPIIIDPKVERPEERTGFTYPDLSGHVLKKRSALVTAALTIMLAYVQAGCPRQTTRAYGSFDDWYQKIAGALMWLGEPDPCEGRKALQAEVEDELLHFQQLVLCWEACYQRHTRHTQDPQAGGL